MKIRAKDGTDIDLEGVKRRALQRSFTVNHITSVVDALVAALSVPNARYDHGGIGSSMEISICGLLDEAYEQALIDVHQAAGVVEE